MKVLNIKLMLHDNYQMYMVYVQKACSQLHFSVIDIDTQPVQLKWSVSFSLLSIVHVTTYLSLML